MPYDLPTEYPEYFTSTIHNWLPALATVSAKEIIINSFKYLNQNNIARIYGFVIMNNHVHIIWQPSFQQNLRAIQVSFRKHTSKQLMNLLNQTNHSLLEQLAVNNFDRKFRIWKREPLSIALFTASVFEQKLNYIHNNPVTAGLCKTPEDYYYSSAGFYNGSNVHAEFLSHHNG